MFRRARSGSFPDAEASEFDAMFDPPMCGQGVVNKLMPKRKSLNTKTLKSKWDENSKDAPRKQRKFRKKHFYEELDIDLSPSGSDEGSVGIDDIKILDYDDPDLEVPVFWAANDKLVEEHVENIIKKQKKKTEGQEIEDSILSPKPSKDSLPAVTEILEEDEGYPSTDSLSVDEQAKHQSTTSSKKKHSKRSQRSRGEKDKEPVLLALRDLVLQQQNTLMKMALKNKEYRKRLASCQDRVLKLKTQQLDQKDQILNLELDKESLEAESLWLREELATIRNELATHKSRQEQNEATISELREKQNVIRERRKAIAMEARQARSDLSALAGFDTDTEGSSTHNSNSVQSSVELRNEVAALRRLVSRLHSKDKMRSRLDSKDNSLPEWLDVTGKVRDVKPQVHFETQNVRADTSELAFEPSEDFPPQDGQHNGERIPEWLALVRSGEQSSIAELTASSRAESPAELDDTGNINKAEPTRDRPTTSTSQESHDDVPEGRDESRGGSSTEESERRSETSQSTPNLGQETTEMHVDPAHPESAANGQSNASGGEEQITLDRYSEIPSFLSEDDVMKQREKISLDEYFGKGDVTG